jgi:hypothetical protein
MTSACYDLLLALGDGRLPSFSRSLRAGEKWGSGWELLIALLTLLAVLVVLWLAARFSGGRVGVLGGNRPRSLFVALCRVHRLTLRQSWLLWRLARQHGLRDPARLFVEPERFDAARLGPSLIRRKAELTTIGQRLFAGL